MSHSKMSKAFMVTGLASALLFTSACAGDGKPESSSAEASAEATSNTVVVDGVEYGPTIDGMPTMKELASDSKGEWRKTTILPDDPAFDFSDAVVDSTATAMWTEEEIKAAQKMAVEMAVDTIDTSANGAPLDVESKMKWWEENKDKFHPFWKQEMYNAVIDDDPNKPIVLKGNHRLSGDTSKGYDLVYGEDEVHVKDRTIETTSIVAGELAQGKAMEISLTVDFTNVAEIDGKKMDEKTKLTTTYTLMKDDTSGDLLVAGFRAMYDLKILR